MKILDFEISERRKCYQWFVKKLGRLPTEEEYIAWLVRAEEWADEAAYREIMNEDAGDRV